jgi:outer membrane biosynthesis protein TonB
MQLRQLIQPGITASLLAHLLLLGLIVLFSEVHPFGTVTAEPITVDLVTPDEVAKMPDEKKPDETKADEKKPDDDQPQLQLPKEDVTAPTPQAASPPTPPSAAAPPSSPASAAAPAKQQQAAPPERREAAAATRPQSVPQPAPATPPQATPPPMMPPDPQQQLPAYTPPEPDVTVKYGVMLGLPEALPPLASSSGDKPGDGIDATASSAADMSSSLIAKFRAHLKTCAKLPASVGRSDNVFVKLRVLMTPQGKLAAEPVLIEGSASVKALNLKQSAVQALSACQPYDMLPVDRYGEWKVLDLSFTPQDFG